MRCKSCFFGISCPNLNVFTRLFDMDGTLIDSTQGVVGAWKTFAETYPFLDVHEILNMIVIFAYFGFPFSTSSAVTNTFGMGILVIPRAAEA